MNRTYPKTFRMLSNRTLSKLCSVTCLLFTMNGVCPMSLENFKYLPPKYNGTPFNFTLHIGVFVGDDGGTGKTSLNSSSVQVFMKLYICGLLKINVDFFAFNFSISWKWVKIWKKLKQYIFQKLSTEVLYNFISQNLKMP